MKISQLCMVKFLNWRIAVNENITIMYDQIQMWQYMLICGVRAKPMTHLMQYHLLQWEVAKVKPLMNSNMTLTVVNLH